MKEVVIETRPEYGKGRSFRVMCLASIEADPLSGIGANSDVTRPIWAVFAGAQTELRPFAANARLGRKIEHETHRRRSNRMEFLRSAGYAQSWQHAPEGSLMTMFLPELFRADPGMVDPDGIKFVCLTSALWEEAQRVDTKPIVRHARKMVEKPSPEHDEFIASLAGFAHLFAVYVDRRTRCPLVADGRFYAQLLLRCLQDGLASFPLEDLSYSRNRDKFGYHSSLGFTAQPDELQGLGIAHAVAFRCEHEPFEELLAEEAERFFDLTRGKS